MTTRPILRTTICTLGILLAACGDGATVPMDVGTGPVDAGLDDTGLDDTGTDDATISDDAGELEPRTFHCAFDSTCPELIIEGDPIARLGGNPAPFRGFADPSLEYDPDTGVLWLSYSWLQTSVADFGPPPVVDFTVQTHIARSDDDGRTFQYVNQVNDNTRQLNPSNGVDGWMTHEVSTLVRRGPGDWELLWITYHDPLGDPMRTDFHYQRTAGASPDAFGAGEAWIGGQLTGAGWMVENRLAEDIAELADCSYFTEPALFQDGPTTYLATHCLVIDVAARMRNIEAERLVLLRENGRGYELVGTLLDHADAAHLGVDLIEQVDFSVARDDSIVMLGTPIIEGADPAHQGCIVYQVEDLATATLVRDSDGNLVPSVVITADGNGLGPGLCTYDAASESGILLVITQFDFASSPPDLLFSTRATGIHP